MSFMTNDVFILRYQFLTLSASPHVSFETSKENPIMPGRANPLFCGHCSFKFCCTAASANSQLSWEPHLSRWRFEARCLVYLRISPPRWLTKAHSPHASNMDIHAFPVILARSTRHCSCPCQEWPCPATWKADAVEPSNSPRLACGNECQWR